MRPVAFFATSNLWVELRHLSFRVGLDSSHPAGDGGFFRSEPWECVFGGNLDGHFLPAQKSGIFIYVFYPFQFHFKICDLFVSKKHHEFLSNAGVCLKQLPLVVTRQLRPFRAETFRTQKRRPFCRRCRRVGTQSWVGPKIRRMWRKGDLVT